MGFCVVAINNHLSIEDFEKIFHPFSAKYMFKKWLHCGKMEGIFRLCLATNEVLAWDRAIAGHVKDVSIVKSINYN